jgi:hypothetical protein
MPGAAGDGASRNQRVVGKLQVFVIRLLSLLSLLSITEPDRHLVAQRAQVQVLIEHCGSNSVAVERIL